MKMFNISWVLGVLILSFTLPVVAGTVNVNKASAEEISSNLTGVGMVKAQKISEWCAKHTCSKPEDLLSVKGIGEKTIEKNRQNLVFGDDKH